MVNSSALCCAVVRTQYSPQDFSMDVFQPTFGFTLGVAKVLYQDSGLVGQLCVSASAALEEEAPDLFVSEHRCASMLRDHVDIPKAALESTGRIHGTRAG